MSKRILFLCGLILCYLTLNLSQHLSAAAAFIVEGSETPGFWNNHAILVVQIRHTPRENKPGHDTLLIPVNTIIICAANMAVPTKLTFECDFKSINMQFLAPPECDIAMGRLFLVCLYHEADGRWEIQNDVMIGGCMPQQMAMYPIRSLNDPVIKAIEMMVFKQGKHWLHWAYRVPGVTLQKVLMPAQSQGHAIKIETLNNKHFFEQYAIVIVRSEKMLPEQYVPSVYPPFAEVVQVHVLSKLVSKISIPSKLNLYIFYKRGSVGTVLPPRNQIKLGRLYVVVIAKWYSIKSLQYWEIRPQTRMAFMPGMLAMLPIQNLHDTQLMKIRRALTTIRK